MEQLLAWDRDCFVLLNGLGNPSWDPFFLTITITAVWFPLFLYFIWLAFDGYSKAEFYSMLVTTAFMAISVTILGALVKYSIARPRPYQLLEITEIIRALKPISGYSFFSGHAASSFAIITLLWQFFRKEKPWFFIFYIWAFLFTISRIYIGLHFPLDSIVGVIVGVSAALIFYRIHLSIILPKLKQILQN